MKRQLFIIICAAICTLTAMAQDKSVVTHQTTGGRDRFDFISLADAPQLEYDSSSQEIIVSCGDDAQYYVTITLQGSDLLVFESIVVGPYDTFSTAMATAGDYTITLTGIDVVYKWVFNPSTGLGSYLTHDYSGVMPNRPTGLSHIWNYQQSK